ncbi:MAG TPA: GNAT family N-acetyltransferase [Solirubrobacteraceae bacterium]|nr:GNAT family N-acetyltransferase [Solirubrobacteraceae bacterium]
MLTALLDPLDDPCWAGFVDRCPQALIFHHPAWLGLLAEHYRYPLAAAAVLDAEGEPVAGIPLALISSRLTGRRVVALPFSDVCPPLVAPGASPDALRLLAEAVESERRRRDLPMEVRGPFSQLGPPVDRFYLHVVDLRGGLVEVERCYASRTRRHVRKAQRMGVEVRQHLDDEALDEFYSLHLRTRRRLGVPTQPKAFVRKLAGLFARGLGFVAVARFEDRPVAAAVFLRAGGNLTYKYGASDERYLHTRPNNVIFAEVIRSACDQGLTTLDLGRTDFGQEGLRSFKLSLGATEETLAYTYRGTTPGPSTPSRAQRASTVLIRKSPPAVGRAIGEVLYRHAG